MTIVSRSKLPPAPKKLPNKNGLILIHRSRVGITVAELNQLLKSLSVLLLFAGIASASEIPNAPSHAIRYPAETYAPDERMIVHNSPAKVRTENRERIFDSSFWLIHGVHAGALSFDLTETSRGVANGCEEASSNLGPHPTTGRLVGMGLAELGGVLALDAGLKAIARHNRMPRWAAVSLGSLGASVGTAKHLKGGLDWTRTGCL